MESLLHITVSAAAVSLYFTLLNHEIEFAHRIDYSITCYHVTLVLVHACRHLNELGGQ